MENGSRSSEGSRSRVDDLTPVRNQVVPRLRACLWYEEGRGLHGKRHRHIMTGARVLTIVGHDETPDAAAPIRRSAPVRGLDVGETHRLRQRIVVEVGYDRIDDSLDWGWWRYQRRL